MAWAAGFWDGEGSVYLSGALDRRTQYPQARLNQSSTIGIPEVLTRFREAVGFGAVGGPSLMEGKQPLYNWCGSSRSEIEATYRLLFPWLGGVKRRQFEVTLGIRPTDRPRSVEDRVELLAWAAGLFDGEGSTYLARHQSHAGYFLLEAAITQSSREGVPEVLERFRAALGVGKIFGPYPAGEGQAPVYRWKSHRRHDIEQMISALGAHLGEVKRSQAIAARRVIESQAQLLRGNPAWGNRKTHCVNGHVYAQARVRPFRSRGVNAVAPRDSSKCLACLREYARGQRPSKRKSGGSRRRSKR